MIRTVSKASIKQSLDPIKEEEDTTAKVRQLETELGKSNLERQELAVQVEKLKRRMGEQEAEQGERVHSLEGKLREVEEQ